MAKRTRTKAEKVARKRIAAARQTGVIRLNLSELGLTALPPEIGRLTGLTTLALRDNQLTALPPEIGQLAGLTTLRLQNNQLTALPPEIGQLTNLTNLRLDRNQLTALPPEIGRLTSLTKLYLFGNQLTALPPEIGLLASLTTLGLRGNQLTALPPEIGRLASLTELYLGGNQLTALPPEIGQLTSLTTLHLLGNQLTALLPEIGRLASLTGLHVQGNQLTALPPEIGQLACLTTLWLRANQLTALPPEIGRLASLTTLDLQDNRLTALPPEIGRLTSLGELDLEGNPLAEPPPEVVDQGTEAVVAYLRERLEGSRPQWRAKLLVVGEGGVGKTCLLDALHGQPFNAQSETTHGIAIAPLELPHPTKDDVTMTLNTWDFGGQQIYHATHQFFLSAGALFVLAWSARLGWQAGKLTEWLERIHILAPGAPILLVATHTDERLADLPYETLRRRFPQIVGHCAVASKPPRRGFDDLRSKLAAAAVTLERMGQEWPMDWLAAAEAIRARKADNHVTTTELYRLMAGHGVNEDSREVLAKTLHELGDILYFADDDKLRDVVLLDPQWVTEQVSKVLECDQIKEGEGVFRREHMENIWPDLDLTVRDRLLRLMERFDLSYLIPDDPENKSLVVERLSQDPADYQPRWDAFRETPGYKEITMTFDLGIRRPSGIPTWFIARSHRFTTGTHWLYGALFADDQHNPRHLALVLAPPTEEKIVTLTVCGPSPYSFFNLLRDGLELTLGRFKGLKPKRTMPCPGQGDEPCSGMFDYRQLESRLERDPPILEAECPECFTKTSVPKLFFGVHSSTGDDVLGEVRELANQVREHDTAVGGRQKQILVNQEATLLTLRDLRAYVEREFTNAFNREQRLIESHCPRVFSLRPVGRTKWPVFEKLLGHKWNLQLYCESPGCWHPTTDGGMYEIEHPAQWRNILAPYVGRLIKVFKYAAPVGAAALGYFTPETAELVKSDVVFMTALAKSLSGLDVEGERDLVAEHRLRETPGGEWHEGADLRGLRKLLDELDPAQHWGDLKKVHTPEGHYFWLCADHAKEFKR